MTTSYSWAVKQPTVHIVNQNKILFKKMINTVLKLITFSIPNSRRILSGLGKNTANRVVLMLKMVMTEIIVVSQHFRQVKYHLKSNQFSIWKTYSCTVIRDKKHFIITHKSCPDQTSSINTRLYFIIWGFIQKPRQ